MNGRGVFSSTNIGRFIATLELRLLLILAVRVLNRDEVSIIIDHVTRTMGAEEEGLRKAHMRIGNLLR